MAEAVPALRTLLESRLLVLEEQKPPTVDTSAHRLRQREQAKFWANITTQLSLLEKKAPSDSSSVSEDFRRLQKRATLAFQTPDQQFQNIQGRLDEMAERDQ